ncbi:casein kinase 2 regulatory subunit, partial [Coemansia erecta]
GEFNSGLDNTDESDFDEEPYGSDDSANMSWIAWFCSLKGHEYFCEVPDYFIEDEFNLTGLNQTVNYYFEALDVILDIEDDAEEPLDADEIETIESSAEILYGLIHARYILTRPGLRQMADKHEDGDFGVCPRFLCENIGVVPCARTDVLERDSVKLFCPSCLDIYSPPNSRFNKIDGAYFGTTFPHLLFQAFPSLIPEDITPIYTPKIYGFAINEASRTGPRMQWLRVRPLEKSSDDELGDSTDSQSYVEARDADTFAKRDAQENDAAESRQDNPGEPAAPDTHIRSPDASENMDVGTDRVATSCASTPAPSGGPAEPEAVLQDESMTSKSPALGHPSEPSVEDRRKGSPASAAAAAAA